MKSQTSRILMPVLALALIVCKAGVILAGEFPVLSWEIVTIILDFYSSGTLGRECYLYLEGEPWSKRSRGEGVGQ